MSNALYDKGREKFLGPATGQINWANDTIKIALATTSYTPNLSTDDGYDTVSPYTVGIAQALASKTTAAGVADGADVTFSSVAAGATVRYIVIFKDTGTPSTSPLIALIDTATGLPVTTNNGDITIQWDDGSNKIFKL
jgi:hypothetical protein